MLNAFDWPTIIIAIVAILALIVSLWTSKQAYATSQANLITTFLERYGSIEMYKHLAALGKFEREEEPLLHYLVRLVEEPNDLDDDDVENAQRYINGWGDKLEPARRDVTNFYKRAWRLNQNGYLSDKALRVIAEGDGVNLLFGVIRPLLSATRLIKIYDGEIQSFQKDLSSFGWLKEFENFLSKGRVPKKKIDQRITWGLIGSGLVVWSLLYFVWPLHLDNMDWHPNLVTLAGGLLGFGLGRRFPERPSQ